MQHMWVLLLLISARLALAYEGAEYLLTFESTWGEAAYPLNFPPDAHFAPLVGATMGTQGSSWQVDAPASNGLRILAETELPTEFTQELASRPDFGSLVCGPQLRPTPGMVALRLRVSKESPVLVLASGMRPSPDWFVGVPGVLLWDGSGWADTTITSPLYSAGTDRGTSYESPNEPRVPEGPVRVLMDTATGIDGSYADLAKFQLTFIRTVSGDGAFPTIGACEFAHGGGPQCPWFATFESCADATGALIGISAGVVLSIYVVVQIHRGGTFFCM